MNRLGKHLAPVLLGSWMLVVGAVTLADWDGVYRPQVDRWKKGSS